MLTTDISKMNTLEKKNKKKKTEQYMYNFFSNLHTHLV